MRCILVACPSPAPIIDLISALPEAAVRRKLYDPQEDVMGRFAAHLVRLVPAWRRAIALRSGAPVHFNRDILSSPDHDLFLLNTTDLRK